MAPGWQRLPLRRRKGDGAASEPPFDPSSWSGALMVIVAFLGVLWAIQIVNAEDDYGLDRFGLRPRQTSGLWGVLTQPLLHASYGHLASNTVPLLGVGWVLMLSGIRVWAFVSVAVVVVGGLATWLVAPHGLIVGASGMVFGWMGYLLARAFFSRRVKWIVVAIGVLAFFGTLLGSLTPGVDSDVSWQSHLCSFVVGVGVGWLLHPRRPTRRDNPCPRATGGPLTGHRVSTVTQRTRIDAPIAMIDSGVGGLTVARAVLDQLPHESLRYVGDTANGPYGPKPIAEVRRHALAVMDDLLHSGEDSPKALVIACNSASAACLRDARERYDVPVVEVILPAVRRAVAATRTGRIGVIGTIATVTSGAYDDAFAAATGVQVTSVACPRFAEFVERGVTNGRQLLGLAESYLAPLNAADVDTLVLGCTHYPLLTGLLSVVMGDGVTLVSSAEETAKEVYRVLTEHDLLRPDDAAPPRHDFRATGPSDSFLRLSRRFLGPDVARITPDRVPAFGGVA